MAVVLISGCSSGFGLAFAAAFSRRGDRVVATMRNLERQGELDAAIKRDQLQSVEVRQLDVTDRASIDHTVAGVVRDHGGINVLVNNAGIAAVGALEVVDETMLRAVFETNFFGAIALTKAVLPHMRTRGSGRIVFMSAIGALLNTAYFGAYGISKAAITALASTWDTELRPFGIRVSAVLPSAYRTAISGNMQLRAGEGTPYEQPTRRYHAGLTQRIAEGPADLSPVVEAVIDAATNAQPRHLYLVAPRLAEVLQPVADSLEALHTREVEATRPLQEP
jgi:NAD(P)-dependent dehydrogenase (short-subunit alcohol dehydrogenase family)